MAYVDRDYTYRVVNDAYLVVHGLARCEIVGRTVSEVMRQLDASLDQIDRLATLG